MFQLGVSVNVQLKKIELTQGDIVLHEKRLIGDWISLKFETYEYGAVMIIDTEVKKKHITHQLLLNLQRNLQLFKWVQTTKRVVANETQLIMTEVEFTKIWWRR